jgi:hypothetical protein
MFTTIYTPAVHFSNELDILKDEYLPPIKVENKLKPKLEAYIKYKLADEENIFDEAAFL